ncbi:hypothetical protein AB3S75_019689 [Citrus x aurantiifolia]
MIGRKKKTFFNEIKLKIQSKISSWQQKLFSSGGKEVLIKAVAQAVPAYAMSVFKIPAGLCDDIQRNIAGFWWSKKKDKKGISWTRWEEMSRAKIIGGMAARVLKARYFPRTDFLRASIGSNPSYIWRSIMWGRQVIHNGHRWRIGNGEKISVYRGNWIPRPSTFKPLSRIKMPIDTTVSMMVDNENRWKTYLIQQNFVKDDAEAILSIPLPRRQSEDEVIWHYDKRGKYTVKSGYQVALKLKFPDSPACSNRSSSNWNVIWKLTLPAKIKIFVWRAAKNLLPTTENLWKRKIIHKAYCKRCGNRVENTLHALITCKAAKKVWQLSPLESSFQEMGNADILGDLMRMQKKLSRDDMKMLMTILWVIWYDRNKLVFEDLKLDPRLSMAKAEAINEAFRRTQFPEITSGGKLQKLKQSVWTPPPQGWLKLNVDAATDSKTSRAGLGAIIRDSSGKCMAAGIKAVNFNGGVSIVEAEAAEWGVQIAQQMGMQSIILETDSQEAADLINNRERNLTEIGWTISEIQSLKKTFSSFETNYVPRACNISAHLLAKVALEKLESFVWMKNFPPEISHVFI